MLGSAKPPLPPAPPTPLLPVRLGDTLGDATLRFWWACDRDEVMLRDSTVSDFPEKKGEIDMRAGEALRVAYS
eukprot:1242604-Amorphochlora_amoeboformis.AAC.1